MKQYSFRLWLEGMEEYEPFRKDVESKVSGRTREEHFPFESWWPDGQDRVFIPMGNFAKSEGEKEIVDFLKDFKGVPKKGLPASDAGYELVNYKGGLAKPIGGKNSYRIMKIINGSMEQEKKEIEEQKASGIISELSAQNKLKYIKNFYDDLISLFQNDPARASGTQFYTVISKNPHDLASISTGRSWTSCMNLITGSNKATVWCELKNGGFVAYMIRADDMDVQKPLARILIRRFDRRRKSTGEIQSVAVPEDVVYGSDNPDFVKLVKDWLRSKQGEVVGSYYRRGGEHSDTFGSRKTSLFTYEINEKNIMKLFNKYLNSSEKFKKSQDSEKIREELVNTILNNKSITFNQDAKNLIFGSMFPKIYTGITYKYFYNNNSHLDLPNFLLRFPEMFKEDVIKKYIEMYEIDKKNVYHKGEESRIYDNEVATRLNKLYQKHPEFFDDDDLKKFDLMLSKHGTDSKNISPKALEQYKDKIKSESRYKLDVNRFDNNYKKENDYYKFYEDLYKFIDTDLQLFKPLPPEIVRQIINLWNNRDKLHELWKDAKEAKLADYYMKDTIDPSESKTRISYDLAQKIMHLFSMTNTDIPAALNWVDEIINIKGLVDYRWYAYYLAGLGYDNGKRFLPFLQKQKEMYENKLAQSDKKYNILDYKKHIENFNYIIDSILTGERSKKYVYES
jgi:hypothetical protein